MSSWVQKYASFTNRSRGYAALTNVSGEDADRGSEESQGVEGEGGRELELVVHVPEDEKTLRRALKSPRASRGGAVVIREGDHWPTRMLKIRACDKGTVTRIVGGPGQPRVWGQISAKGGGGLLEGVAFLYLTRASVKPTVSPRPAGANGA